MADELTTSIEGRISYLANVLQNLVKDYAPNHLKRAVHAVAKLEGDQARIQLTVDKSEYPYQKNGSKDARAQEFGLGPKSETKPGELPVIVPIDGTYLKFIGTKGFAGQIVFTRQAKNVGFQKYQGHGYVRVAIVEFKKTVAPSLDPDIRRAVHLIVTRSFGRPA